MAATPPLSSVLIAEDSPETLAMLADAVEAAGFIAMVALRGDRALSIARQATPDIILLDAVMPGLDGFETCRQLKHDGTLSRVPVIFMTGLSDPGDIVRGLEAGGVDYITKPIDTRELLARIRVHLANARLERTTRMALDDAGRYLVGADRDGRLRWWTPQAGALLSAAAQQSIGEGWRLPAAVRAAVAAEADPLAIDCRLETPDGIGLRVQGVSRTPEGETVLRVAAITSDSLSLGERLERRFGLSAREADVALWLSKGKANRDIAEILGLSPMTVKKHLERVFRKLGVENRTAAAAAVHRLMNDPKQGPESAVGSRQER